VLPWPTDVVVFVCSWGVCSIASELQHRYYPLEVDHTIPLADKVKYMEVRGSGWPDGDPRTRCRIQQLCIDSGARYSILH
jgi:hypothetical protein